ncbi:MAG: hypothetical protein V4598_04085 [Bdellovibrionota bacterium]
MKKFLIVLTLLISQTSFSQDMTDADQYPEVDPSVMDNEEFISPRGLPPTDYEEVPREEQVYVPDETLVNEMPPEEVYEADEEYLE